MSTELHDNDPRTPDIEAAEYVLGTLDPTEHAAVEARLPRDRALASAVYAWQDRLLPLAERVAPMPVPKSLWDAIRNRLGEGQRQSLRWWQQLGWWQAASALSLLLAVALGVRLLSEGAPAPHYLAVLNTPDNHASWVVEVVSNDTVRLLPVGTMPVVPAGKSLQFWTKPKGATKPTSLGLVTAGHTLDVPRAHLPAVGSEQLFEVTLEPQYGSTTGRPTGPILAVGRMVRL
jgi:anti-sigma-K factor RskA